MSDRLPIKPAGAASPLCLDTQRWDKANPYFGVPGGDEGSRATFKNRDLMQVGQ
jgi:hypothetical protein